MAKNHVERCSTTLVIRVMQIKTIMKHHFILVKMSIMNKCTNDINVKREHGKKGTLLHCWWECKLVQPLLKTVQRFLKKLKIELLSDIEVPFLCIYPDKAIIQQYTCTSMFRAALFTIAMTWK